MHLLRALRAPDVRPPLLHLNPDVGPQTLAAEQVRAVEEEGEAVDGHGKQAQRTFPELQKRNIIMTFVLFPPIFFLFSAGRLIFERKFLQNTAS